MPRAQATFAILTSQNRYAVLYRINTAKKAETRAKRVEKYVDMLDRGQTIYPQARILADWSVVAGSYGVDSLQCRGASSTPAE